MIERERARIYALIIKVGGGMGYPVPNSGFEVD